MTLSPADEPAGEYSALLNDVLAEVRAARIRAGRAVNAERTMLYWRIGNLIPDRQQQQGWGTAIIDRLAADLAAQFPGMPGWSPRSCCRTFPGATSPTSSARCPILRRAPGTPSSPPVTGGHAQS